MRAVWQRVSEACVTAGGEEVGRIGRGALVLLGVEQDDTEKDAGFIADKCVNLRLFEDETGRFNRSLLDVGGEILIVSQFTLLGDCRKGRRPSFSRAARPEKARRLYETVIRFISAQGLPVQTGRFQAYMQVSLVNNGPVTVLLDSRKLF